VLAYLPSSAGSVFGCGQNCPGANRRELAPFGEWQITRKAQLIASKENGWTVKCSEEAGMGAANEESLPTNLQLIG
jgi:hypothetical protein